MAISASQIVNVTPRTITAGGNDLEITGLFLTKNPLCVVPGIISFTSASAVGAYFGTDSPEYLVASSYFIGYDNSFVKPRRINFARRIDEDCAGFVIGGTAASLKDLKEITDGAFSIDVDGETKEVTGLDLSGCSTQSEMAEAVADAIGGVAVEYNSNLAAFIVTSDSTGELSSVSVATAADDDTTATLLGLTKAVGATVSAGSNALDIVTNMANIKAENPNWATFTTMDEAPADEILQYAEWVNGTDCEFLYCPYTTDVSAVNPQAAELPKALSVYEGVLLTYGTLAHAAFAMAIAASIDWNRTNSLCTWMGRSQSGLDAYVTDDTTAENAKGLNVNFYGRYATRNDDFVYYYQGKMIGGIFNFVDAYIGQLWLRNNLQLNIMSGLGKVSRVPYNNEGYTIIKAWCMDSINTALTNGVIDKGVSLSESQKAELYSEIGADVSDQIYTEGYYLLVADPGASVRANRESPTMGIWYTYAGSVHKIELPVTAIL